MNYSRTNKDFFAKAIEKLLKEKGQFDPSKIKPLISQEISLILKKIPQGINKSEFLESLKEIFGSHNFKDGKYEGGKELVLEIIYEFFGKENFEEEKYKGGWNEPQDTKNIKKIFKAENFTNGEYTGGWNKQQDSQNLEKSLTGGEAKTITSQLIEQKLGGADKFQEGIFKTEEEVIKIAEKAFENKGSLLRKIRNIIGEKEFFPEDPGDGIPPGREGMRVASGTWLEEPC